MRWGLLTRTVYPEVFSRVEYELTDPGYSLRPVLDTLNVWGEGYQQVVAEVREDEAQAQVL